MARRAQTPPLAIAILAGGESRRMGVDKASIDVGGRTFLEWVSDAAASTELPTFVVGRAESASWSTELEVVLDRRPGQGPLAGLEAALEHAKTDVMLIGCDMPWVSGEAISWLVERRGNGAVARREQIEPLFAVYPRTALSAVRAALDADRRSLTRLIPALKLREIELPAHLWSALDDADEPDDLERA